ncbi:rhamnan synthesis F family protein [Paraburkholderia diazotrophica]|uniref:Glycosyl transferases group 1 n=1 Tax=Paraburkholderia diazotrophica TaxID=667676 RepID=A0A1H7DV04_9BURK|nr:rhamnan synthesis F family protein [Paraburkholderia diazotrophica]SEK02145.1 Glycosyl transferases group 1 [Paraburkholderia diazotrophica]
MTAQLPPTGERFLPELMPGEIALEHQHRYHIAAVLARGLDVLDVASGEGYGSSLLADVAKSVVGVDIDEDAIGFASRKYCAAPNLRFAAGACSALPLQDASVDLVVSFETIEHHDEHEAMLAEIKRVLRPGGMLIISSPDKHEYSDAPNYRNPYHVAELYRDEFEALLGRWFRSYRLYGQRVRHASTFFAIEDRVSSADRIANFVVDDTVGTIVQSASAIAPRYLVAIASDHAELPALAVGTFADRQEEQRIERLGAELQSAQEEASATRQQIADLQSQNRVRTEEVSHLRLELQEWRKHADALEVRAGAQEAALRQIGERHAKQLIEAHDGGVQFAKQKMEGELSSLRSALSGVQFAKQKMEGELSTLRSALAHSDAQFQSVVRSWSWRITRPLRVGRRLAARFKRHALNGTVVPTRAQVTSVAEEFDEKYYLRRYADVANAGIDPYQHYAMFGRPEGRSGRPPKLVLRQTGSATLATASFIHDVGPEASNNTSDGARRGAVLVVSHEATRTGAPILAWNICRELREHYEVVALLLGKGPLLNNFDEVCDAVAGPYTPADRDPMALSGVIGELCDRYDFEFAVVNSIASRSVLQPLAERYVPSTLLVHEFYKFHCSPDELVDTLAWACQVVFSAKIVLDSADIERTHPAKGYAHVVPQGKSQIPGDTRDTRPDETKGVTDQEPRVKALQNKILRGRTNKPFIVLGAGTIEYRKGVDLFVATAAEIERYAPDADILMVWVGGVVEGYKQYAEFVTTQVEQSGLADRIEFVGETPDLEALYRFAEVCFVPSRLDPLPNIALDAITAGLPVLSFENATGVAENFKGDPQLEQCVLPFLDVQEAARRIIALYNSPTDRRLLSQRMTALAADRFDMSRYVAKLIDLAKPGRRLVEQERADIQTLLSGKDFAEWFYLPSGSLTSREEAIQQYVKASQAGIYLRKPAPGFYPNKYTECHALSQTRAEPFAHYIAAGRPSGAWQEELLDVSLPQPASGSAGRIAVHIHAFYPDLLADIVRRLSANELEADLFISVPSAVIGAECENLLFSYRAGTRTIRVVPNSGRDIGPFVTEFGSELLQYNVIGHFHTKKSVHVDPKSNLVRNWVNHLMETLLGTQHRAAEAIVSAFANDPKLGLVFADDPHLIGWDKNLPFAKPLAQKLGLDRLPEQFFSFPVGTMFWARPAALKALFESGLQWEDYPSEPLPIDGSMLHALERLLPSIVQHAGYRRKVTYAAGLTR